MFDDDAELDAQESRIQELKRQAEETSGGEMFAAEMFAAEFDRADVPPAAREQFWATVRQYNTAAWTSEFEQLRKQGVNLPPPEQLDDAAVSQKLAEIAHAMSERNVFIEHTDHLSDRALYETLYHETLHEAKKDVPLVQPGAFSSIDLVGSGSEEDTDTFLRFYADDETRANYEELYPQGLPPRQPRPFDRDRHLPQPPESPLIDDELPLDERWLGEDTVR